MEQGLSDDAGQNLNSDVEFILEHAPRLMTVAAAAAISFALWDGVNRALVETDDDGDTDRRDIAAGYREDCAYNLVTRLFLLLDRNPKLVSFQTLYTRLKSDAVVSLLVERLKRQGTAARG